MTTSISLAWHALFIIIVNNVDIDLYILRIRGVEIGNTMATANPAIRRQCHVWEV